MKRGITIFSLLCLFACLLTSFAYLQDRRIQPDQLPANARDFIKTHFGENASIAYVEKEWTKYEVMLTNGYEIKFNNDGSWRSIEAHRQAIPNSMLSILPGKIKSYIEANHKGWVATDISKKDYGYEVELTEPVTDNDVELKFNKEGELIKIDY